MIAFTKEEITSYYAVKFGITDSHIDMFGEHMPIRIINYWEVNIRPCEMTNFAKNIDNSHRDFSKSEHSELCQYLTETGFSLSEIIMFSNETFAAIRNRIVPKTETIHFFDYLQVCRKIIGQKKSGSNILRYLLHHMNNKIIKKQHKEIWKWNYKENRRECVGKNDRISNLYLASECLPFDNMPFCTGLVRHVPNLLDLLECLDVNAREHEMLARTIKNNTEQQNILFTPLERTEDGKYKIDNFSDIDALVKIYNNRLYVSEKQQARKLMIKYDHIYIDGYADDTISIIKTITNIAKSGVENYENLVNYWMQNTEQVNCAEKKRVLLQMFSESKVALVYGSAGTGKSYLINHVSNLFSSKTKLYLAQTNSAVINMRRKVTASANGIFMTISKFIDKYYRGNKDFDILVIDECSTVNNSDMRTILDTAHFELLVLVGDTYQIESIEFGNWFDAIRNFLPNASMCELTQPYRSDSAGLLRLWNDVRNMKDDIFDILQTYSFSGNLDSSIFTPIAENEIILCLNYGGLYGVNNINHFLQESNNQKEIWRSIQRYKVGDPILFNDNADKFFIRTDDQVPIIHNDMKGRIVDFELQNEGEANERIQFDIEIDRPLIEMDARNMDFSILKNSPSGNSIIRFSIFKNKSTDEDESDTAKTLVPFQIAYAVSIHKAQGLEYDSVKIIITDEVDEMITHSIFYTAITRARKSLKIYWAEPVERKVLAQIKPNDNREDVELLKLEIL